MQLKTASDVCAFTCAEEAKECMYGSEELDKQLKGLGLDMADPEIQEVLQNTGTPKNTTERIEDISGAELPDATIHSVQSNTKKPAEHAEGFTTPQLEPDHKEAATEMGSKMQKTPWKSAQHIETISVSESEPVKDQAAAQSHRSCLGDLEQARGIWDNMKAILGEPAAPRKPLEPLVASNSNAPVEAKPERAQRRANGYRSNFSFIKQVKD